jgi:hypothetical protein
LKKEVRLFLGANKRVRPRNDQPRNNDKRGHREEDFFQTSGDGKGMPCL